MNMNSISVRRWMRTPVLHLAGVIALATGAAPIRRVNTFELVLQNGRAELEWITSAAFRYTGVDRFDRGRVPIASEAVDVSCAEDARSFTCRTQHVIVTIEKAGGALRVDTIAGKKLLAPEGVAGEIFYGLGTRKSPQLALNGSRVEATGGLLISTAGYGEYRPAACAYDFTGPRRSVQCGGDLYFYYGPSPKEILEEHSTLVTPRGETDWIVRRDSAKRSWSDLRTNLYALQQASMSGLAGPPFALGGYEGEALERARQIAAFMPVVHAPSSRPPELRTRLLPYLETYAWEAGDRGIPAVRPLAMQFPEDATAATRTDEFMVGDELLLAPVLGGDSTRKVYLPRGVWTELRSGAVHKGRQEITVQAPPNWTPVFARNGMIVPLAGDPLEMHYYPRLGAEFFLWESDIKAVSQFHAAPATDFVRLESESLKDRSFDWVVHNLPACKTITEGGRAYSRVERRDQLKPGTWLIESGTIRVRVRAQAGGNEIVHLAW